MKNLIRALVILLVTTPLSISQVSDFSYTSEWGTCDTDSISFTNLSTGAVSYYWDFGDGNNSTAVNPSNVYAFAGTYVVQLTAYNGLGDSTVSAQAIYIEQSPFASFWTMINPVCPGEALEFQNGTWPFADSYQWDFDDGSPVSTDFEPTHTFAAPGVYNVQLIAYHSCGNDTVYSSITVDPATLPFPGFGPSSTNVCPGEEIDFTNFSSGATSYSWDFGDLSPLETNTNVSHSYSMPGIYNVTLTAFNACNSDATSMSITVDNTIVPSPSIFATPNPVCSNDTVDFSVIAQGAVSYAWDFGDGNNSTTENPSHAYAADGGYGVNLDVTNYCGNTGSAFLFMTVGPAATPTSSFSASTMTPCVGQSVNFTNNSWGAATASWDFGDGSPLSSDWDAAHSYAVPGSYLVTLTVTNSCGQSDISTVTVNVGTDNPPFAGFSYMPWSDICTGTSVNFDNWSSDTTNIVWDWGDASPNTTTANAVHSYAAPGNYTVLMSTSNACGTSYTAQTINVVTDGAAETQFWLSTSLACPGEEVQLWPMTPSLDAVYDWGDGSPTVSGPDWTFSHTYNTPGIYVVTNTITNGCGTFTYTQNIEIKSTSVANFSTSDICLGGTANFTDLSTGTPDSWGWDFGDGGTDTAPSPSYTYGAAGTFDVSLTVVDQGCLNTYTQSINVYPTLSGATSSNMTQCDGSCDGDATVTPSGGNGSYTYLWDAAAGSQTTSTAIGLCPGPYNVTVTDGIGCSVVLPALVSSPSAVTGSIDLITSPTCNGDSDGQLTLSASGGTPGYDFSIDNGLTYGPSPITGLSAGSYNVIFRDANGCTDTLVAVITEPDPITASQTVIPENCGACDGSATITPAGGNGGYTYFWSPAPGAGQGTATPSGMCAMMYTCDITDMFGCTSSIPVLVGSMGAETLSTTQTPASCNSICDGTATVSYVCSDPPCTVDWLDASSASIGQTTETAIGLCAGTYYAEVTNNSGCVAIEPVDVLEPDAIAFSVSSTPDNGSSNGTASVTGVTGGDGSYTYSWDAAAGSQTTATAVGLDSGTYTVTVIDGNGCSTDSIVVVESTASIDDVNSLTVLSVYPNPTHGDIQLTYDSNQTGELQIIVYDAVGREVYRNNIQKSGAKIETTIPSKDFVSSFYLINLNLNGSKNTVRFLKTD